MDGIITPLVTVLMGLIGVAIVAALVSNKSNTANVIKAGGNAFTGGLGVALSPITGGFGYTNTSF